MRQIGSSIAIRIPLALDATLTALAKCRGTTISDITRIALQEYIDRQRPAPVAEKRPRQVKTA